jgi:two-component system OmpR family sensor kinase
MLEGQMNRLQEDSYRLISKLRYLHEHFDEDQTYPRFTEFRSAIYDSSKKLIFTTLNEENVNLDKTLYTINENIHYVRLLESYYLGAMYVVIEVNDDGRWFNYLKKEVVIYGIALFVLLLWVGYYLFRMMLSPMRNSLSLLDRFIKDTTHELNTPISAILTNIEMIDEENLEPNLRKKIRRIDIASRTISNLYKDLTFAALGNRVTSKDEKVNMYTLIKERIEFFKVISSAKNINCITDLQKDVYLVIDRTKITRIIDNLLSNAIKYNKRSSFIKVKLRDDYFEIEDGGIGIRSEAIENIFDRYTRFNTSEGGFGLGLNIVKAIADEYGLKVKFTSEVGKGTKVQISWSR